MREIGGYIELDSHFGSDYHEGAVALNCGRTALEYILEARDIKKLYLPYFCCDSVAEPCRKRAVEMEFYPIDRNFRPIFEKTLKQGEWLLIINFYGQIDPAELAEYAKRYERIIADNTQAYFQKPVGGMDTLCTCRKYFGVSDGAFLYTDTLLKRELPVDESFDRVRYVLGRYERGAGEFYAAACANNDFFSGEPIKKMSKLTHNLLRTIDYPAVARRRRENFAYLHQRLGTVNALKLTVPEGAFMYPLYLPHGAQLRKKLQGEKIFVPTLWPDVLESCDKNSLEYDYAANILPLPVDQRYTIEDMEYLCEVLKNV